MHAILRRRAPRSAAPRRVAAFFSLLRPRVYCRFHDSRQCSVSLSRVLWKRIKTHTHHDITHKTKVTQFRASGRSGRGWRACEGEDSGTDKASSLCDIRQRHSGVRQGARAATGESGTVSWYAPVDS